MPVELVQGLACWWKQMSAMIKWAAALIGVKKRAQTLFHIEISGGILSCFHNG